MGFTLTITCDSCQKAAPLPTPTPAWARQSSQDEELTGLWGWIARRAILCPECVRTIAEAEGKQPAVGEVPESPATCCECGDDYPLAELAAGEVFCRKCVEEKQTYKRNVASLASVQDQLPSLPTVRHDLSTLSGQYDAGQLRALADAMDQKQVEVAQAGQHIITEPPPLPPAPNVIDWSKARRGYVNTSDLDPFCGRGHLAPVFDKNSQPIGKWCDLCQIVTTNDGERIVLEYLEPMGGLEYVRGQPGPPTPKSQRPPREQLDALLADPTIWAANGIEVGGPIDGPCCPHRGSSGGHRGLFLRDQMIARQCLGCGAVEAVE